MVFSYMIVNKNELIEGEVQQMIWSSRQVHFVFAQKLSNYGIQIVVYYS